MGKTLAKREPRDGKLAFNSVQQYAVMYGIKWSTEIQ